MNKHNELRLIVNKIKLYKLITLISSIINVFLLALIICLLTIDFNYLSICTYLFVISLFLITSSFIFTYKANKQIKIKDNFINK